jgi:hypothetical protein
VGIQSFLGVSGHCEQGEAASTARDLAEEAGNSPDARAFGREISEDACRVQRLGIALKTPERFCPGVDPSSFARCYTAILETISKQAPLTSPGFVQMTAAGISYYSDVQPHSASDWSSVLFGVVEVALTSLDLLERRHLAPPALVAEDRRFSAELAETLVRQSVRILRRAKPPKTGRGLASGSPETREYQSLETRLLALGRRWKRAAAIAASDN